MRDGNDEDGAVVGAAGLTRLEVLRQGLEAVCEEMGTVLERAAFSPNIKERRDHSCALFNPVAELVAQAEHIPVHLGAMPKAVRAVIDAIGPLAEGDVGLVNDPHAGGTHLPDLTMVTPVDLGDVRLGYLAARAHHADVGGAAPGSMPAGASSLIEEGLVIPPVRLVRDGAWDEGVRDLILSNTRSPEEREGDLRAQHGALVVGARRLRGLAQRRGGADAVLDGMRGLIEHTTRLVEARLAQAEHGTYEATEVLEDDGAGHERRLHVRAALGADHLLLDYEGTASQSPSNLNAPLPVTLAGVQYVARLLLGPDIPPTAGFERVIDVHVPEGTVLNPSGGAAVAGGNVETSQRNVDLLLSALAPAFPERVPAQSQGTMNNVTLGGTHPDGRRWTYYETLGGGEGATPHRAGRSGIHTHMTNTRNTPIEALEHALPLLVTRLTLRRGTGGAGEHDGGDGLVRALRAMVDGVHVHLLTQRRTSRAQGLGGGGPGAAGANRIERGDGRSETLGPVARALLAAGDELVIETPGGGAWGPQEPVSGQDE